MFKSLIKLSLIVVIDILRTALRAIKRHISAQHCQSEAFSS